MVLTKRNLNMLKKNPRKEEESNNKNILQPNRNDEDVQGMVLCTDDV
jgi:hypothetical protein